MEKFISNADLVVSMGGYNTICEILSQKKVSLIVPRETPRLEQRIRAEVMKEHSLLDFLPWSAMSPASLAGKLDELLTNIQPRRSAVNGFALTGLDVIRSRLEKFQNELP
jgi:predicted glycosyltransferase